MMNDQQSQGLMGADAAPDPQMQSQDMQSAAPDAMQGSAPQQGGAVDVQPILDGIEVPPKLKPMYDKMVLSGMRIMFSKDSHKLFVDQLQQPGPLADKISKGVVGLMYLLWTQSNKTLPPQLMIPTTTALAVRAFDYVQKTGNPEATKEVLGQAIEGSIDGVMKGFNTKLDDVAQNLQQKVAQQPQAAPGGDQAAPAQATPSGGGGLMDAMGAQNG